MTVAQTVSFLSKSASLEHKSDATRLRRSPAGPVQAVVDTVRRGRHIAEERGEGLRRSLAGKLAGKLAPAHPPWGVTGNGRWDADEVLSRADYWMRNR